MNRWIWWTALATVGAAVLVHFLTLFVIPLAIMQAVMSKVPENVLIKSGRTTADSRTIVRPSPDLVYTLMAYDVSQQPIRIKAQVPGDAYWSLSFFAANTDNFYVLNDQQAESNQVNILLIKKGDTVPQGEAAIIVTSPSDRGIMLIRHLLVSDDKYNEVVQIQAQASVQVGY